MPTCEQATGGCLCGDVRYQAVIDEPNAFICACKFCQKHTGGPYLAMHGVGKANFELIRGKTRTYSHKSIASGMTIDIRFCEKCGTKIYMTLERYPAALNIYTPTIDDPSKLPHDIKRLKYNHYETAQSGTVVPAGFEVYWEHYNPVDGPKSEPTIYDEPFIIEKCDSATGAHTGGCLCGRIRFEADGIPNFVIQCHCKYCQKILGSGMNIECMFAASGFRVTNGHPKSFRHKWQSADKPVEHKFCETCGTAMFLTGESFSEVGVFRGALDQPDRIQIKPENSAQIFLDEALPSGMVCAGIAAYKQHMPAQKNHISTGTIYEHSWRIGDGL